ncbi:MAG TPA: 2OG-Fe(II) oxygenase, partial [Chryseolinea sp.]|nr:2OG-Fe(II) oxygenase [Chryseolinea sp.]
HYERGGFNTLHQDLYGEVYFPFQVVIVLTQDGVDHTGGELVLTEQMPRAQSKAEVIRPKQGDGIVITTNFRPMKGTRGYYRSNMKHGVSEVKSGRRYALGIIFHDAS